MSQKIIYYCDYPGCGKEFIKHGPPWEPDYCPEHMEEYHKYQRSFSTYTAPKMDIQAWYLPANVDTSNFIVGASRWCKRCHTKHPAGPCENWRPNYGELVKIFDIT